MYKKTKKHTRFQSKEYDVEIVQEDEARYNDQEMEQFDRTFRLTRPRAKKSIVLSASGLQPVSGSSYSRIRYRSHVVLNDVKIIAKGAILVVDFALYTMQGEFWKNSNEITFSEMFKIIVDLNGKVPEIITHEQHRNNKTSLSNILSSDMEVYL